MEEKLNGLRRFMKRRRVQAYLVPSSDPHQSEYVPACWKRRQFMTGFTGSAGEAVVTLSKAGLWTDSRYYLQAVFPGGFEGSGFEGIEAYIRERRQSQYLENLSRKLLAYALNRSLQLSDEPAIERIQAELAANGYRFSAIVDTIVTSPQFVNKRQPDPSEKGIPTKEE